MKMPMLTRVLFCCAMFWLSAGTTPASTQQSSPSNAPFAYATVADFKGKVQVQLPNQGPSAPTRGEVLPPESVISTEDGRILLRLEDASEVLVYPHTRLVLKQPSANGWQRLQVFLGRIRAEIKTRLGGSPPFQVGTPSAVISVRGTRFYVEVDTHKTTEVHVEKGAVLLENAKGIGAGVLVTAGSSSRVGEDSAPEPARPTQRLQAHSTQSEGADQRSDMAKDDNPGLGRTNPSQSRKAGKKP